MKGQNFKIKLEKKELTKTIIGINQKHTKKNKPEIENKLNKKPIDNSLKEFYYLMNILECNNPNNKKIIKNRYSIDFIYDTKLFELNQYNCSSSKCLKCKRQKHFNYIKNRIPEKSFNTLYFITVSSPYDITDIKTYTEKTKKLRQDIRNIFSYLKIMFISSLEKGDIGNKLHIHILVFQNSKDKNFKTSIYITDFIRAVTGYYTNSEIVNLKKKNETDAYLSKMVGYASKFQKDKKLSDDNFIELKKNNFLILKTIKEKNLLPELRKKAKNIKLNKDLIFKEINEQFKMNKVTKKFIDMLDFYNDYDYSELKNLDLKLIFYTILSIAYVSQSKVFDKGITQIKNKIYKKMKKQDLAYKMKQDDNKVKFFIEENIFYNEFQIKIYDFLDRFFKGVFTKYNYYLDLIEDLINYEHIEFKDNKVYHKYFFTSDIKKRILSNISIFETKTTRILDAENLRFKENIQKNIYKHLDFNKLNYDYHYIKYTENFLNLRFRVYRIENDIDKAIYETNIINKNVNKNNNKEFKQILNDSLYRYSSRQAKKNNRIKDKNKYTEKLFNEYKRGLK